MWEIWIWQLTGWKLYRMMWVRKLSRDQHLWQLWKVEGPYGGELVRMLKLKESYWRQHFRIKWIKEGDRNTKFFIFLHQETEEIILGLFIIVILY